MGLGDLVLDTLKSAWDYAAEFLTETTTRIGILWDLMKTEYEEDLTNYYNNLDEKRRNDVVLKAYYDMKVKIVPKKATAQDPIVAAITAVEGILDPIADYAGSLLDEIEGTLLDPIFKNKGVEMPASVKDFINTLRTPASIMLALTAATSAGELVHPLKELGLGRISAMVYKLAGWDGILNAFMSPLINASLGVKVGYDVNSIFTPYIVTGSDLLEMAYKGDLRTKLTQPYVKWDGNVATRQEEDNLDNLHKFLSWQGYDSWWVERIEYGMYYEPRFYDLLRASDTTYLDEEWVANKLARAGFSDEDISIYIDIFRKRSHYEDFKSLRIYNRKLFEQNVLTEDEFKDNLKLLGYSDTYIPTIVEYIKEVKRVDENEEFRKAYERSYKEGFITETEFIEKLTELGYTTRFITARKLYLDTFKTKEVIGAEKLRTLTTTQILNAYKKLILTEKEAATKLEDMGYKDDDIEILLALYAPKV